MKLKVYISGPMTGIKDYNYPAFAEAKKYLEMSGYEILSPHEAPKLDSWNQHMKYDIKLLCDSDAIFLLPGWEKSTGARLEKYIADAIGIYEIE
jgi:hypothetical protein